jgi:hypothetical protein
MEGMVGVAVVNNTMAMVFTFATSYWFEAQSVTDVMCEIGALSCVFIMTALPMMYWGKAARKWTLGRYNEFLVTRDQVL